MPEPPKETLPHPYGVDVELLQRTHSNNCRQEYARFLEASLPSRGPNHGAEVP